jgi:copper chaperone CopZ
MKKIFILIFLSVGLLTNAQVKKVNLRASGLTCAMCSKAVFKSLSDVPFVEKIQVDIQQSTYEVFFKEGAAISFDALSKAVIDAGFSVDQLKVTSNFNALKLQKDAKVELDNQTLQFINANDQTLNGEKTFTLIDKSFVSAQQFKKYKLTAGKTYETGFAGGKRVYHAIL